MTALDKLTSDNDTMEGVNQGDVPKVSDHRVLSLSLPHFIMVITAPRCLTSVPKTLTEEAETDDGDICGVQSPASNDHVSDERSGVGDDCGAGSKG
jgi:hypothetical protein